MGRAFLVGCLGVFAVLFVAGGGLVWWFVGRPATAAVAAVQDLGRIEEIRAGVREDGPYDAPADGLLDPAHVDRYLAVQAAVREDLEDRFSGLRTRYEELEARRDELGPAELARAWSDGAQVLADAARAQVDALNAQGFSREEYRWVRARVLEAAGHAVPDVDLARIAAGGGTDALADSLAPPEAVPEANVQLVAPHLEAVEETLPLAWFGL